MVAYEKNQNFGQSEYLEPEYKMTLPEAKTYCDVNADSMAGADEFANIDFDPRPTHLRNMPGYQDFFRNHCFNLSGISEIPIFQIFVSTKPPRELIKLN